MFRRDDSPRIFNGSFRERIRKARQRWRNDDANTPAKPGRAVLATPFVPSVAAHREAVDSLNLPVDEPVELSGGELRVRNYVSSIAASSDMPIIDVLNGQAAGNFAESIGADLERVKLSFQDTEEE
jgi:hypothetical protein